MQFPMKAIIFYRSSYLGNTLKIARAMAGALRADLVSVDECATPPDLSAYDLIGFGSGINFAAHDISLQRFASRLQLEGKNVFVFSTRCRPILGSYHKTLRRLLAAKGARIVGEISFRGYDRTGPWVLLDGYNKDRPNSKDLFKARLFAEKLRRSLHPLAAVAKEPITEQRDGVPLRRSGHDIVAGDRVVFLDTSTCINCGKCVSDCPMHLFARTWTTIPTQDRDCIQCNICADRCPTESIYINESTSNGLRIALRETFTTRLQRAYRR